VDAKFPLGQVVITPNAARAVPQEEVFIGLARHVRGDWGDVDGEDRQENELALVEGFRLMSVFAMKKGDRFWIITEADRSVTTVLLPEDY